MPFVLLFSVWNQVLLQGTAARLSMAVARVHLRSQYDDGLLTRLLLRPKSGACAIGSSWWHEF